MIQDEPSTGSTISPEAHVWSGGPSQWTNFVPFLLCILVLPIPWAIYRWLFVKCTRFILSTQRLRIEVGILSKAVDDLEIYRVKDITLTQPFIQRLLGLGSIRLVTSDVSHPHLLLAAIPDAGEVRDLIRDTVEKMRRERGVRELDIADHDIA